jgi:hypothetical protein
VHHARAGVAPRAAETRNHHNCLRQHEWRSSAPLVPRRAAEQVQHGQGSHTRQYGRSNPTAPDKQGNNEDSPTTARCYAQDKTRHDQTLSPEGGSSFWGRFHTQGVGRSQQATPGPPEIPAGSPRLHRLFSLLRKRDQVKDPRKNWGLSDTCQLELVAISSLSKAKCFKITTLNT